MESHPDMAKGFVKGDKVKHDQMWVELTNKLNACGPPNRDTATWKKVCNMYIHMCSVYANVMERAVVIVDLCANYHRMMMVESRPNMLASVVPYAYV